MEKVGEERAVQNVRRTDDLFTDRVSIDLHAAVTTMTISGLMAPLKGDCMNWERVQLNGVKYSESNISVFNP